MRMCCLSVVCECVVRVCCVCVVRVCCVSVFDDRVVMIKFSILCFI